MGYEMIVAVAVLLALIVWQRVEVTLERHGHAAEKEKVFAQVEAFLSHIKAMYGDQRDTGRDVARKAFDLLSKKERECDALFDRLSATDFNAFARRQAEKRRLDQEDRQLDVNETAVEAAVRAKEREAGVPLPEELPAGDGITPENEGDGVTVLYGGGKQ